MDSHLKWADTSDATQRAALEDIVRGHGVLMEVLEGLREMKLPDHYVGSGAIYNAVWSHLTGKPLLTGTKDIDVIYFDGGDISYGAEDAVIRAAMDRFAHLPVPVEVRNQARVHLWYPERFGFFVPPLDRSRDSLLRYASRTHAVAVRLETDDSLTIEAPFGLNDMFAFRITPNYALDNKRTHHEKGARAQKIWPGIEVVPW